MTTNSIATATEQLRLSALDQAVQTAPVGATAEQITKRAEDFLAFLAFLTGGDESATAKPEVANTVHVHVRPEDTHREPGERGRRKRLVQSIVRDLRHTWPHAAEWIEAMYGETR